MTIKCKGELSRNIEDAQKALKTKPRKLKEVGDDLGVLEQLDKDFEDIKKPALEQVDDQYKIRKPKEKPKDVKPKPTEQVSDKESNDKIQEQKPEEIEKEVIPLPCTEEQEQSIDTTKIKPVPEIEPVTELDEPEIKPKEKLKEGMEEVKPIPTALPEKSVEEIVQKEEVDDIKPLTDEKKDKKVKKIRSKKPDVIETKDLPAEVEEEKVQDDQTISAEKPKPEVTLAEEKPKPIKDDLRDEETKPIPEIQPKVDATKLIKPKSISIKIHQIDTKPHSLQMTNISPVIQNAVIKEIPKKPAPKKRVSFGKLPKVTLKSRSTVVEFPPKSEIMASPIITNLAPAIKDNGILSRTVKEAEKVMKKRPKKPELDKLDVLDKEMEELKKNELEKVDDEFKQTKPKIAKEKPIKMKVERWEVKPEKVKVVEVTETPINLEDIKLKKKTIPKKEVKSSKLPKVLLSSRIEYINFPPLTEIVKRPVIDELNPAKGNGILSRNIKEAEKIKKKKIPKVKEIDEDLKKLEELDREMDELKKKEKEKVDDQYKYERKPKDSTKEKEDDTQALKLGKGKVPDKDEAEVEPIKLRKIPEKMPEDMDDKKDVPAKKDIDVEQKDTKDEEKEVPKLAPIEPYDVDRIPPLDSDQIEPEVNKEEEEQTTVDIPKKPKYKKEKPEEQDEKILIKPGKPKDKVDEDDTEIQFKIPEIKKDIEKDSEIRPKDIETTESASKEKEEIDEKPEIPQETDSGETERKTIKRKSSKKSKKTPSIDTAGDETGPEPDNEINDNNVPEIITVRRRDKPTEDENEEAPVVVLAKPLETTTETHDDIAESIIIKPPIAKETEENIHDKLEIISSDIPKDVTIHEETELHKPTSELPITPILDLDKGPLQETTEEQKKPEEKLPEKLVSEEKEEIPDEAEVAKVTIKTKRKPKPEEDTEEVTIKKIEVEKPKDVEAAEPAAEVTIKPKHKPKPDEGADEVTIKKVEVIKPDDTEAAEPAAEVTIKPKGKPIPDEGADEVTIKKIEVIKPDDTEAAEPAAEVTIKPKRKPKPDEGADEVTIKKIEVVKPDDTEAAEPAAEVTIKPKRKPKPDEGADEVTIKKVEVIKPDDTEAAEPAAEVTIKPKRKPKPDEGADEVTIKKIEVVKPDDTEAAEPAAEVTIKPKRKPKPDEGADEVTIKKIEVIKPDNTEAAEPAAEVTIKPKRKPKPDEGGDEITIKKLEVVKPDDVETTEPAAEVTIKPKPKPKSDEGTDETTIKKIKVIKPDVAEEDATVKKKPSSRKGSLDEHSEDITVKRLRPTRKSSKPDNEEIQTVTFRPKVTKSKEDVEQEFKIQLDSYAEEEISMSGKIRLKRRPTYGEEMAEDTVKVIREIEDEGPTIEEIIDEGSDAEELPYDGEEEDSYNVPLKRKPKRKPYKVQQESEEEISLDIKQSRQPEEEYEEESISVSLKPKRKISVQTFEEEAAALRIVREHDITEDEKPIEEQELHLYFSISTYTAETDQAIDLVEGERIFVLETENPNWWLIKKNLTEEKGWVPANYLMNEHDYAIYLQKKLNEQIDKLPIFEKPTVNEVSSAPRFLKKLQPQHAHDGSTVQFECKVEGIPRPQITWFRQTAIIKPSQDFEMFYNEDNVATLIIKEVFPEDAGTFTCVAKNSAGFASSTTELIVELPLSDHGTDTTGLSRKSLSRESSLGDILEGIVPIFSKKPLAQCVDEGTDVTFECRLIAVPEPTVTWLCNGKLLSSKDNVSITTQSDIHMYTTTLKIKKVKKSQEGTFKIKAKNREGQSSVTVILKVRTQDKEAPQVLEPLKSFTVQSGETVILSTHIVGTPTPKVTWYKNDKPISVNKIKEKNGVYSLTISQSTTKDTAKYTVKATNPLGSAETSSDLNVEDFATDKPEPPLFTERFEGLTVTEKSTIRLFARVIGNPVPEVIWLKNNEPLKPDSRIKISYDGENIELTITNANPEVDSGDYKCIASNIVGKASHGAMVIVDVETVKFTKKLKKNIEIFERETLVLECETSHIISTKWFHNNKEITGMDHHVVMEEGRTHKLTVKSATLNDSGTYKCTVKNQKTETTVTVVQKKPEFIRKLQDCEVKEKETAILEVEVTSDTADVIWKKDGQPISESDDKFTIEKEGGIRKLIIRNISIHDEGEYSCSLPEDHCNADLTVIELPPEIITKMVDQTVTKGEKATFEIELTKGDALVRWFKDGNELQFSEHIQLSIDGKRQKLKIYNSEMGDKGIYSCQVGDQKSSAKLTVKQPPLRFIQELPEKTLTKMNIDVTLTVELNRSDVEVEWLRRGRIIEESTKYTILSDKCIKKMIIHNVKNEDEVEYSCRVEDLITTTTLKIEIIETLPKLFVDDSNKLYKVRKGENVTFTVKYTGTPTPADEWSVNYTLIKPSRRHQPAITEENVSLTIRRVEFEDKGNYTIKLKNNCGEASAELTLIVMDLPNKPGTPELVDVTDTSITLHWKAPEFDGNTPIINYIIEYRDKETAKWTRTTETITTTTTTLTKIEKHKEYSFRVIAVNEVGESEPSNNSDYILIATPTAKEAPTILETLKDIKIGLNQKLTLTCVITGNPTPDITWFKDGKIIKSKTITYENHVATYIIKETEETTEGIYTVKAQNVMGTAETTCHVVVQEAPTLQIDEELINQTLKVNEQWKVKLRVSGYPHPDITWKKDKTLLTSSKHTYYYSDEMSTNIVIYSLERNDTATYTVIAENSAGFAEKEIKLRVVDKPTPPQGPMGITNIEMESATISWHPPLDDGGVELTKYLIEKYEISSMTWTKVADVETSVTSYTVQQLQTNAEYIFRVYAQNSIGKSEPLESEKVSLKSTFKVPSPPRAPLEVSGMTATSFTISWQPSSSDGGSSIIEYIVEIKEANRRVYKKLGATRGAVTNFAVNYLEKDQGYNFKIIARNAIGLSEPFLPDDTITAGARITTPSPPRNLKVTESTSKSATIIWETPENNGGTELTGYVIERKYEYMPNWEKAATLEASVHQFTFENLREKTKYVFRVFAENCVGLSSPATTGTIDLFTYATVPSPPTAPLEIRTIGPNAIVIEWGIPEYDGGSPLLGYNIAIRDTRKTMWMEVGRVAVPTQKFTIRDLQEDHEYLIRVFARNEIGLSEPLDSDEPFRVLPSTDNDAEEFKEVTEREPTSYSTETTTSWLKDNSMDADIYSYSKGKLLQKNEYFFKIWCFADELFK